MPCQVDLSGASGVGKATDRQPTPKPVRDTPARHARPLQVLSGDVTRPRIDLAASPGGCRWTEGGCYVERGGGSEDDTKDDRDDP